MHLSVYVGRLRQPTVFPFRAYSNLSSFRKLYSISNAFQEGCDEYAKGSPAILICIGKLDVSKICFSIHFLWIAAATTYPSLDTKVTTHRVRCTQVRIPCLVSRSRDHCEDSVSAASMALGISSISSFVKKS
jgi:hypothetical protein